MSDPQLVQGRWLSQEDLELIRRLMAEHPHWSRRRVSVAVSEALNWRVRHAVTLGTTGSIPCERLSRIKTRCCKNSFEANASASNSWKKRSTPPSAQPSQPAGCSFPRSGTQACGCAKASRTQNWTSRHFSAVARSYRSVYRSATLQLSSLRG
jgi:hypothetical protein